MHPASWHIVDSAFAAADEGLTPPPRVTEANGALLQIESLDRADPPSYRPGSVPRGAFNRNQFHLTGEPRMPAIEVRCTAAGFDPAITPIFWRLVSRHVLCRHSNVGSFRYRGSCQPLELEWRGESRAASFTLFDPASRACTSTYNDASRVLGGHALLMVAALVGGAVLIDFVHLRIAGVNPSQPDVFRYLDSRLTGFDQNIVLMVRAIFRHESAFSQFAAASQSAAAMTFSRRHHAAGQPDCRVRFDWPDDPPRFPLASFDFGVGISQFTQVGGQVVSPEVAWDWRENIRLGTNLFLKKLERRFQRGMTWRHWALAAWSAYNGAGAAAERYARQLAMSDEGARISLTSVEAPPQIALLTPVAPLGVAEPWVSA